MVDSEETSENAGLTIKGGIKSFRTKIEVGTSTIRPTKMEVRK
jgi:hypothetical protein